MQSPILKLPVQQLNENDIQHSKIHAYKSNVPIGKREIRNIPTLQERQKTEFLQFRFIEIQGQKKGQIQK